MADYRVRFTGSGSSPTEIDIPSPISGRLRIGKKWVTVNEPTKNFLENKFAANIASGEFVIQEIEEIVIEEIEAQ